MSNGLYLYLDYETRSPLDIKKVGLENYARSAEVLMLGWALNDSDVRLWLPDSCPNSEMPDDLAMYLFRPEIVKVAWNMPFERAITKYALGIDIPVSQWIDVAVLSRYAGCPSHLGQACEVLGLPVDESKDKEGTKLIRTFCMTGKRGHKTPEQAPELWEKFKDYCRRDVAAERALLKRLAPGFTLPARERRIWELDQKINERGIPVDLQFVQNAAAITERERARLLHELKELTGLENPNSTQQLLAWLRERGYPYSSLGKKWVDAAVDNA